MDPIDDYSEVYQRLSLKVYLAYGIGHVLNDVCASMWFTYLLVFFHLVLNFSNTQAGTLLLIGQIADALSTPFVGYHSDQGDTFWICKYGKRKTWHLLGTICVILTFPFIFSPCVTCADASKWSQMIYYSMFIIIFQFGWASVQISHLSLIPEISPNEHDRTRLTAVRYGFTVMANVCVYVITWTVLHMSGNDGAKINSGDATKFQRVVWSVMSLGVVCSCLFHLLVRENGDSGGCSDVRGPKLRSSYQEMLADVQVYQAALNYMCSRLFINLTQVFITLYLHETLDMVSGALAVVPLTMYIASLITSLLVGPINQSMGRKLTYLLGALLGLAACLLVHFGKGPFYSTYLIYMVACLLGAASSIVLVSSLGVTTDLIGTRTDSGAFLYGIMSFVDKLSNGIVVEIIQDGHKDETNIWYYRDVLTYVCGGSLLIGTAALLLLKRRFSASESNQELLFGQEGANDTIN